MKDETAVFKWTAAAVAVILVCFSVGFFVLGPKAGALNGVQVAEATGPDPSSLATPSPTPGMLVQERTQEIEDKKRRAEEARKKAEEEKRKKEEEARKKAEEAAKASPSPSPTPTPTPDASPTPAPTPEATPTPEPTPDPIANPNQGDAGANPTTPATPASLFRVRVGGYGTRAAAEAAGAELNGRGYSALIVSDGDTFRLQVGAYRDRKTAEDVQKELRANGYEATVSGG